eukprot:NODE_3220_length_1396_cov_29.082482_g2799_i0.p1 GENE.NODE_3220_length_1396_cov_29.082482_g2799_i0~~NODE_3220_length_1396_cov_29.082482_g2799_i0.p1  ORF type:complete len:319 (-),score=53.13 NODE_3220_length_1396_cov_29.082482_g2799_i0:91-1047(-)
MLGKALEEVEEANMRCAEQLAEVANGRTMLASEKDAIHSERVELTQKMAEFQSIKQELDDKQSMIDIEKVEIEMKKKSFAKIQSDIESEKSKLIQQEEQIRISMQKLQSFQKNLELEQEEIWEERRKLHKEAEEANTYKFELSQISDQLSRKQANLRGESAKLADKLDNIYKKINQPIVNYAIGGVLLSQLNLNIGTLINLKRHFDIADRSHDGKLKVQDLGEWVVRSSPYLAHKLTFHQLQDMISIADWDKDGMVSLWEFIGLQLFLHLQIHNIAPFEVWMNYFSPSNRGTENFDQVSFNFSSPSPITSNLAELKGI